MAEPRWLSADEQTTWRSFLAAIQLLHDELDRELQRDAGMPHAYYQILAMLSEAPGRTLRMSELATRTSSSRSRLSHAITRLEEAGWVRRESCPTDKRGANAVLTDAGFGVLAAAAPGHVEEVRRVLFDRLSAEQVAQLRGISDAVTGGPARPGGSGGSGGSGGHDGQDAHVVEGAGGHDQHVPDLVVAEDGGERVGPALAEQDPARRVEEPAGH